MHEVETMFVARELAWHGLGTFIPEAVESEEAIVLAGLDWKVRLEDAYTQEGLVVPNTKLTRRSSDDSVLGVVGDRYHPIQNQDLFDFSDTLVEYGARYESAGSLRFGKYVFTTMVIEKPLIINDDPHIPYLVMASSHDGSMATRAILTPVRVVCMNTLRLAVGRSKRSFTIRHTRSAPSRIEEARRALGISFEYYDGFEAEVEKLMAQEVSEKTFDDLIEAVWPKDEEELRGTREEKKVEAVKAIYLHDPAVKNWTGTAWGALNAFNTWELWDSPVRKTKFSPKDDKGARQERQALDVLRDGAGVTSKVQKLLVSVR